MKISLLSTAALAFLGTATAFVAPQQQRAASSSTSLDAIAVFGASGLTAQECIYQALKDGDKVVGLTRNPSNCVVPKGSGGADADKPLSDPNLTLIGGDVTNPADVAKGKRVYTIYRCTKIPMINSTPCKWSAHYFLFPFHLSSIRE